MDDMTGKTPDPSLNDVIPAWREQCDRITKFAKFFRTRRHVVAGEALWDMTKAELGRKRLMEPWPFNGYQSVLSASPAFLVGGLLAFILPEQTHAVYVNETAKRTAEFIEKIQSFLLPLFVPIALAITAYAAARGSLSRQDITPESLGRARRGYLYFDGAFGLWSQMVIASTPVFALRAFNAELVWIGVPLALAYFTAAIYQIWLTGRVIPMRLFELNGYPKTYPKLFSRKDPNAKRWSRYTIFWFLFAGFAVWAILFALVEISALGGIALVVVQDWFRHLFGVH